MRSLPASQQRFLTDIHRLLATLLYRDIADPRFNGVTITRMEPSGRQLLTVWVYHNGETDQKACIEALNRMAPHFSHEMRRVLSKKFRLPSLQFKWDINFEKSGDVLQMLRDLERP